MKLLEFFMHVDFRVKLSRDTSLKEVDDRLSDGIAVVFKPMTHMHDDPEIQQKLFDRAQSVYFKKGNIIVVRDTVGNGRQESLEKMTTRVKQMLGDLVDEIQ